MKNSHDIALFSLGNFLCYIPIMMMTKMASKGLFASQHGIAMTGFEILPLYAVGSMIALTMFLIGSGWWKYARQINMLGLRIPRIHWYIVVSGLATVGQIITATWVYTFDGVSIVFATLLMKGGVLALAPVVDLVVKKRKRQIYWPSWLAASLSFLAIFLAFLEKANTSITVACTVDILLYLTIFFIKLVIMSRWAKSSDAIERKRFIAEEQMVILFGFIGTMFLMGIIGYIFGLGGPFAQAWNGFTVIPRSGFIIEPIIMGLAATGSGVFASLIFLDRRENTFCVAITKISSILAGVAVTILLYYFYGQPSPSIYRLASVIIIVSAIFFLTYRGVIEKRKINAEKLPKDNISNRTFRMRKESV